MTVQLRNRLLFLSLFVAANSTTFADVLFQENFDSLSLRPVVTFPSEASSRSAWTNEAPGGWEVIEDGVLATTDPANEGVIEFRGWTFLDKDWWIDTSGDQDRSQYRSGYGIVAVADPDEFDDFSLGPQEGGGPAPDGCDPNAGLCYDTLMLTPSIPLGNSAPNSVNLIADSSWRFEDTQAADLAVAYDGGAFETLFTWSSDPASPDFKPDAVNEVLDIPLNNPEGASEVQIQFRMFNAGNDWWWAIDNMQVYTGEPGPRDPALKAVINRETGNVTVQNGTTRDIAVRGYSLVSESGSFDGEDASFLSEQDPANWLRLTQPGSGKDLSEGHLSPSGATLATGDSVDLGDGSWEFNFRDEQDISFSYLVPGSQEPVPGLVEFVGNEGTAYEFLDLNFDGAVDLLDWETFLTITDTADLSSLTEAQAYRKGDLDADGRLGVGDFIVFQREFDRINGAGSLAAATAVPEPASATLLFLAGLGMLATRARRR